MGPIEFRRMVWYGIAIGIVARAMGILNRRFLYWLTDRMLARLQGEVYRAWYDLRDMTSRQSVSALTAAEHYRRVHQEAIDAVEAKLMEIQ